MVKQQRHAPYVTSGFIFVHLIMCVSWILEYGFLLDSLLRLHGRSGKLIAAKFSNAIAGTTASSEEKFSVDLKLSTQSFANKPKKKEGGNYEIESLTVSAIEPCSNL